VARAMMQRRTAGCRRRQALEVPMAGKHVEHLVVVPVDCNRSRSCQHASRYAALTPASDRV